MKRLAWIVFMPILALMLPWVAAIFSNGRTHVYVIAALWCCCILIGLFVAIGPAIGGLALLGVFQLVCTPWLPTRAKGQGRTGSVSG